MRLNVLETLLKQGKEELSEFLGALLRLLKEDKQIQAHVKGQSLDLLTC
jgi:hypothetical protein